MVVVPAGSFTMGSPASEPERSNGEAQIHVTIARSFAVGKFAVTFDEWDACVADGGCNGYRPGDQGWGRGKRPVINVSWDDAKAYTTWLSRKTGKTYRLLSEAEREYVTRAGTTTPFWWGSSITPKQANYDGSDEPYKGGGSLGEYRKSTVPVDSFEANPWGLYNVHGNVWEWTEDCWNDSNTGNPGNGSARTTGDCHSRVVRGGSWPSYPLDLRVANRSSSSAVHRRSNQGFRLARTLEPAAAAVAPEGLLPGVDRKGIEVPPLVGFSGPPEAIDASLQTTPLWRIIKREFPDWYAERLKEIAALAADNKNETAIGQHLARALVALRRQQVSNALAAGFPLLKVVAMTFYENLVQLRKHSKEACFEFISRSEASPLVVSLMQNPAYTASLQAQLVAVFEAIADGRKAARAYPQPRKADYDTLGADLTKRGWSQSDWQLFSDERALARAAPEKVCQLVHDWFAAQLALKDPDMQLRLLVNSLKPVVAG